MIEKPEDRNPKSEGTPKSEIQNQNSDTALSPPQNAGPASNGELHKRGPEAGIWACPSSEISEPPARPNPRSSLQNLPRARQEELFRYCETQSLKKTVQWLAKAGVKTSQPALTRFRRWFHRRRMREDQLAFAREMIAQRRRDDPHISEEEVARFGRNVFARLAIDAEDERAWARQQLVRQREIKLELEQARVKLARQKFTFDAAKACMEHFPAIKAVMINSTLSEPEKIKRIEQALFGCPGGNPIQAKIGTTCNGP